MLHPHFIHSTNRLPSPEGEGLGEVPSRQIDIKVLVRVKLIHLNLRMGLKQGTMKTTSLQPNFISRLVILASPLFISACILTSISVNDSPKPSFEEITQVPTNTPIPLPLTIESVRSNCSNGECLSACLSNVNSQLIKNRLSSYDYSGDDVNLVYYGISKTDELEKPRISRVDNNLLPLQQNVVVHKIIWDYFKELFPRETRPNLVTFGIYISSISDGKFDTTLTENWIMKINILALEDSYELSSVLIHEYGHYLTLNETQRQNDHSINYCRQKALYYCQSADSYINQFYLGYWEDIYPEWRKIDSQSRQYEEEINSFYQKYSDRFLNDYAATDPVEDIAESWTAFVLESTPSGDSVAEQKVNFFYNFPELVELRYQIIKGICAFNNTQ